MKKNPGGRPRSGLHIYIRADGHVSVSMDVLERLQEAAEMRGIIRLEYIGWEAKNGRILIWPNEEKNEYAVKIQVYPEVSVVRFRSRLLAKTAGAGKKRVEVIV